MGEAAPDPERERIVEHLFRALTGINTEGHAVRRPQDFAALVAVTGSDAARLRDIVDTFRADGVSFLTPYGDMPIGPATQIDISHEALIRCWQKIADREDGWLQREFQDGLIWKTLRVQAGKGETLSAAATSDRDAWLDTLPSSAWTERYDGGWPEVQALMEASRKEQERRRQEREARRRKEIRQARIIALVSLVAFVITAALAAWALYERGHAREAEVAANRAAKTAESEKRQRTRQFFDSSLTHASLLAENEDYATAREALRETLELDPDIPETRRHARNLLAGHVHVLGGSADKVYAGAGAALIGGVAVSPDGRWLAAAGELGILVLFDAESGELLKRLEGHDPSASTTGDVGSVVFEPEGHRLYSGGDDGRIIRWFLPEGEKLGEWQAPASVWALAIGPHGKLLASGGTDNAITLWSAETGERLRTLEGRTGAIAAPNGLDFSSDGERLASASHDRTARIWDVEIGKSLHTLQWHNDRVEAVAFSPNGDLLATAGDDKRIVVWDADSNRPLRLWDVATGVTLRVYQGHTAGLSSVARHGDTLYTAANDQSVRRWSLATSGQWVSELPGEPDSVAISPDASLIAVGFGQGALRDYERVTGTESASVEDAHGDTIIRLAFIADGTLLASASFDHTARLWRVDRSPAGLSVTPLHALEGHTDPIHAVAFSPDRRTLATAGYDGRVGLFDVASGEGELFEAHEGRVADVEFDADGRQLLSVGADDFRLRLWDLTKQAPEPRQIARAQDQLAWATLRPDGRQLAAVGRGSSHVTLHDLGPEPAEPQALVGHEQTVLRAVYSPNGRQLAAVSADMTVRLWDLEARKELFAVRLPTEFRHPSPLWDFDFRCTGQGECWIAFPLTMGRLALYRLPYHHPAQSLRSPSVGRTRGAE